MLSRREYSQKTILTEPRKMVTRKTTRHFTGMTLILACSLAFPALGDEKTDVKKEQDTVMFGNIEAGVGYQSDDSFWFGRYTGLTDKGPFFIGNLDFTKIQKNGEHTEVTGRRLGLDSRSLLFNHGIQGRYELDLIYDQLPNFISDTAVTPYVDSGGNSLTLPGSVLDEQIYRQVDIETQRRRLGGKFSFTPTENWKIGLGFRTEEKEGTEQMGASLGYSARNQAVSVLPKPINYTTDLMDASVEYAKGKGHVELAYHLSVFRNDNESLTWQNPFPNDYTSSYGRLALEPDNDFQQLMMTGGYRLPWNTYFTGLVSSGLMTQDQQYLPYTINSSITTQDLPRDSLDGKIRQNTVHLKLASRPATKWNFNGSYRYHDHDNSTPQASYTFPIADSQNLGVNAKAETDLTAVNQPFSYTQQLAKLDGKFRFGRGASLMLGYDFENMQRENSEVDETDEHEVWGKLKWKIGQKRVSEVIGGTIDGWLKLGHTSRDGTSYHVPTSNNENFYIENPLLRKYNLADLERDELRLFLSYSPLDNLNLSANASYAIDDYDGSIVGLTEAKNSSATVEATYLPAEDITSYIYYTLDLTSADQAGREAAAGQSGTLTDRYGPDWFAHTDDTMNNFGLGVQWQNMLPKLDLGADYIYSKGVGETELQLAGATPFPNIETQLHRFNLYAHYNYSSKLAFRLRYWHEEYSSDDWSLDGVVPVPADYPATLYMAEGSPEYNVDVVGLSMLYSF